MRKSSFSAIFSLSAPFLIGWFLVGTSGFDLLPELGVFNGKRILEVFVLLLILGATLAHKETRYQFGRLQSMVSPIALSALFLALALATISALRFEHPGYGLLEIGIPVLLIACALSTAAAHRCMPAWFDRLVLLIVATIGVIAGVTELTGLVADWSMGQEFSFSKMLIRFAHPRFYNQLQTLCIPLLAALPFLFKLNRRIRAISIGLLGLQWSLLLMSGGRGSVIAIIAALLASALLYPSTRRAWMGLHVAGLALGAALYLGVLGLHQNLASGGDTFIEESIGRPMSHSSGRVQMWQLAWQEARLNPLLGSGPARYACDWPPTTPSHPHSLPFQVLAEWGIPSFILIMSVCAWVAWLLINRSRRFIAGTHPPDVLTAMLGASLIAAGLHSAVSGLLIMPASQLMIVLIGGWTLGRLSGAVKNQSMQIQGAQIDVSYNRFAVAGLSTALVIALSVSIFSVSELRQLETRTQNVRYSGFLMPRYWHWGRSCQYFYTDNAVDIAIKTDK